MSLFKALRLQALRAVTDPDHDYHIRRIHRWYSKTFSTPLHEVLLLDEEDVLTAYYEDLYENMEEPELKEEKAELLMTEKELRSRERSKDAERAEIFEYARIAAEQERKKEAKKLADVKKDEPKVFKNLPKIEPDMEIKFMSAEDFETELEGFGSMVPPDKQSSK